MKAAGVSSYEVIRTTHDKFKKSEGDFNTRNSSSDDDHGIPAWEVARARMLQAEFKYLQAAKVAVSNLPIITSSNASSVSSSRLSQ